MPLTIITNAPEVAATLERVNAEVAAAYTVLYDQLGRTFKSIVQDRIATQDNGGWLRASKWIQAKKNTSIPLLGAEKYVKYSADRTGMTLYGDTPGEWTLTQHDQGFDNPIDRDRVTIDIVNPGPLNLKPGTTEFSWYPKAEAGRTPARKIWPTEAEAVAVTNPIYSRWLQATITRALEGSGATIQGSFL